MFIEVTRMDGRKALVRADAIECILEDCATQAGQTLEFLMIETRSLKIKIVDETLESLCAKMCSAMGLNSLIIIRMKDIEVKLRPPVRETPVYVQELPPPRRVANGSAAAKK